MVNGDRLRKWSRDIHIEEVCLTEDGMWSVVLKVRRRHANAGDETVLQSIDSCAQGAPILQRGPSGPIDVVILTVETRWH